MAPELDGKRLELLKEAFPKVARVAFLWQSGWPDALQPGLRETEAAATALGTQASILSMCESLDDFEQRIRASKKKARQALITTSGSTYLYSAKRIVDFAAKNRLPAMYAASEFVRPAV